MGNVETQSSSRELPHNNISKSRSWLKIELILMVILGFQIKAPLLICVRNVWLPLYHYTGSRGARGKGLLLSFSLSLTTPPLIFGLANPFLSLGSGDVLLQHYTYLHAAGVQPAPDKYLV